MVSGMGTKRRKTMQSVEHFLQVVGGHGCDMDGCGAAVKGRPVGYQCIICGDVVDEYREGDRCKCGCEDFNPIMELR